MLLVVIYTDASCTSVAAAPNRFIVQRFQQVRSICSFVSISSCCLRCAFSLSLLKVSFVITHISWYFLSTIYVTSRSKSMLLQQFFTHFCASRLLYLIPNVLFFVQRSTGKTTNTFHTLNVRHFIPSYLCLFPNLLLHRFWGAPVTVWFGHVIFSSLRIIFVLFFFFLFYLFALLSTSHASQGPLTSFLPV